MLSTSAYISLRDQHDSAHHTKAELNICFIINSKLFLKIALKRELIYLLIDFHQDLSSFLGMRAFFI